LQQHFHRSNGGLDVHFLAGRRLVQVFLVAVGAAQVAAGVDVEHHGVDRRALDPLGGDVRGQRRAVADQFQGHQLAQGFGDFFTVETRGQPLDQVVRRAAGAAQGIDDGAGQFIAGEQRTAGDMEQHAVGINVHFVQVAFDQIQDSAHGDLPCKPRSAGLAVIPVSEAFAVSAARFNITEWVGCSSVARSRSCGLRRSGISLRRRRRRSP
jgi:hypothetical protein